MNLCAVLEGLLFVVGEEGLTSEKIKELLEIDDTKLQEIILKLYDNYKKDDRGICLKVFGNRLKLTTKEIHNSYYEKLNLESDGNLSQAALETLAIIAYNQPITRAGIDEIRGINSVHTVRKLLSKDLIQEVGRSEEAGRPMQYGTTGRFLDYFGLSDIEDLPKIEVTEEVDNEKDLFESKYKEEK